MEHDFSIRKLTVDEIRQLYTERLTEDFPPDELKPLAVILRFLSEERYGCYGAVNGGRILAYAFLVRLGSNALFDYFAVKKDLRAKGIGSRFLRRMIAGPLREYGHVLLEVDDPDLAADEAEHSVRIRRLSFYLRNGLMDTSVRATVWHVGYRILALPLGSIPGPDETKQIYSSLYRSMMTKTVYDKMVSID